LVQTVAMHGYKSRTIKVADGERLNASEMDMYRRMMRISWTEHRTNNSVVLEEFQLTRRFLAEVKRKKLQYFGHVADNLCTHILHCIIARNRCRGRPRRWNNGQEYPLQVAFNVQKTDPHGDPGVCVGDLRSSDIRRDEGKAR